MEVSTNGNELDKINGDITEEISTQGDMSVIIPAIAHNKDDEEEIEETPLNKDGFFWN